MPKPKEAPLWKPNLAAKPDPEEIDAVLAALPHPALWSPKLDGIRATVQNGRLYSRSLKPIPNKAMQALWGREELDGLDGEIIVGPPTAEDCFNRTTSVVMARDKPADGAVFHVFDKFGPEDFQVRSELANDLVDGACFGQTLEHVKHTLIKTSAQLAAYEGKQLGLGYEGIMRRSLNGKYKQGRSTLKEQGLVAVKRTVDTEAVVLAVFEQKENTNEQTVNELGHSKRSTHKAGKVGKGTLGGFTVLMLDEWLRLAGTWSLQTIAKWAGESEAAFDIGTGVGLTDAVRAELWKSRATLPGKIIKLRYQKIGTVRKPRQPIFLGFRSKEDLS